MLAIEPNARTNARSNLPGTNFGFQGQTNSSVAQNARLGTFPQKILENLDILSNDMSDAIFAASEVLRSLHNRSDVLRATQLAIGAINDGLGFVETLLLSGLDAEESKARTVAPVVKRKKSGSLVENDKIRSSPSIKQNRVDTRGLTSIQNANARHELIHKDITALTQEVTLYFESLPEQMSKETAASPKIPDSWTSISTNYGLENPNPDAASLKASIIRRFQNINLEFKNLAQVIVNVYSRQTFAIISWRFFQSDADSARARIQSTVPGVVILKLGARVANLFSPMMTAMSNVNTSLPKQVGEHKLAVGQLVSCASSLIGSTDVFFAQLDKICRSPAGKTSLPVTCATFTSSKEDIPLAVNNLADLILKLVYFSQNYWHSQSRESRRQLRLCSQNFEDVLAELARVTLENANGPTKDDPSLVPDTLFWVRDQKFSLVRANSSGSTVSQSSRNGRETESEPVDPTGIMNSNASNSTTKPALVRRSSTRVRNRNSNHTAEHSSNDSLPSFDAEFMRGWNDRINSLSFIEMPHNSSTLDLSKSSSGGLKHFSASNLRTYLHNLSRRFAACLNAVFLAVSEHPRFGTSVVFADSVRFSNAEKRLRNSMTDLQEMTHTLENEMKAILQTPALVASVGPESARPDIIERETARMVAFVDKLMESQALSSSGGVEGGRGMLTLHQILNPVFNALGVAVSITKYMDALLSAGEAKEQSEVGRVIAGRSTATSGLQRPLSRAQIIDESNRERRRMRSPSEGSEMTGNTMFSLAIAGEKLDKQWRKEISAGYISKLDVDKEIKFIKETKSVKKKKSLEDYALPNFTGAFQKTWKKFSEKAPSTYSLTKAPSFVNDEKSVTSAAPSIHTISQLPPEKQRLIRKESSTLPVIHESIAHIVQYLDNDRTGIDFEFEFDAMFSANMGSQSTSTAHTPLLTPYAVEAPTIRAGSLVKLVERLTWWRTPDSAFVAAFIRTFEIFTTADELLQLLINRYNYQVPDHLVQTDEQAKYVQEFILTPIRVRVSNVLKIWLRKYTDSLIPTVLPSQYFQSSTNRYARRDTLHTIQSAPSMYGKDQASVDDTDYRATKSIPSLHSYSESEYPHSEYEDESTLTNLDPGLTPMYNFLTKLKGWVESVMGVDMPKNAEQLLNIIERLQSSTSWIKYGTLYIESTQHKHNGPPPALLLPVRPNITIDLAQVEPLEIARQLCLVDEKLFRAIRMRELIDQAWTNKEDNMTTSPNVVAMIAAFNTTVDVVSSVIVSKKTARSRSHLIRHFIMVAKKLITMSNFNSCQAIISALSSAAIYRLRRSWELIPSQIIAEFDALLAMFSPKDNYATLRSSLRAAAPPGIPWIGLFLRDLINVEEAQKIVSRNKSKRRGGATALNVPIKTDGSDFAKRYSMIVVDDQPETDGKSIGDRSEHSRSRAPSPLGERVTTLNRRKTYDPDLINFTKCRLLARILDELFRLRSQSYYFLENLPLQDALTNAKDIIRTPSMQFKISLELEPGNFVPTISIADESQNDISSNSAIETFATSTSGSEFIPPFNLADDFEDDLIISLHKTQL